MSNPFTDLQTALSNATGMDLTLCGVLLGACLTIPLGIMLTWVVSPKGKPDSMLLIIAFGLGVAISTAVGWFPSWIAIFLALIFGYVIVDPFGRGR